MAATDNPTASHAATNVETAPRAPERGRGRGGRGGANSQYTNAGLQGARGEDGTNVSNERGRGRGRGRGGRSARGSGGRDAGRGRENESHHALNPNHIPLGPRPQAGGAVSLGSRIEDAANSTAEGETMTRVESNVDDGCIVCSNPIDHASLTPCNHRYCTICSLRMRALYKTKACAICRTEAPLVIFTDEKERKFVEFNVGEFYRTDENMGIAYEQQAIFEDTVVLLRYNCPDPSCDVACLGWPDLHRHVRSAHQKQMCDLCARNKKVFTHEHELFTQQELRKHEKYGDDNPGAVDQSGFQGHPECGFCRKRFYGEDELYVHCRDSHERCHLCDRRTGGRNPQYYLDYNALEQHFGKDHFPCLDNECLEKKFVVFDSEMDLKAHQLENHPNGLSKDARRDARRVDLSSFDYRPQYQEIRRGGRRGGRGRDPNSDAIPATSGAHMSRAELVHQRQREIQSAQSTTPRTFGGQLTASEPHVQSAQRPANAAQSPQIRNAQPAFPPLNEQPTTNGSSTPRPAPALTPAEQARQLRHNAVTERAAHLLSNDEARLAEFRSRISSYRNGTISASDLIDAFFSLFDTSSAELGKLIKELADIFEITTKRDALLKAWNDWKAINEDYPSLPGPSGPTSAAGALGSGMSGSRVLRLKSATAPSARSTMGQQRSWGATAASANNPFPVLPASNKGNAAPAPTPSWLALRPASSSRPVSAKVSPAPSRSQSSANLGRTDAFPALPAAAKPTSTVFTPGYTGAGVIRQSVGSGVNAWAGSAGGGGGANGGASSVPAAAGDADVGKGKGRKGKNVVFKWG